jgi:hypothetical protein
LSVRIRVTGPRPSTILVYPRTSNREANDCGLVYCAKRVVVTKLLVMPTLRITPGCTGMRKPKFGPGFLTSFRSQDVFSVLLRGHDRPYDVTDVSVERNGEKLCDGK